MQAEGGKRVEFEEDLGADVALMQLRHPAESDEVEEQNDRLGHKLPRDQMSEVVPVPGKENTSKGKLFFFSCEKITRQVVNGCSSKTGKSCFSSNQSLKLLLSSFSSISCSQFVFVEK